MYLLMKPPRQCSHCVYMAQKSNWSNFYCHDPWNWPVDAGEIVSSTTSTSQQMIQAFWKKTSPRNSTILSLLKEKNHRPITPMPRSPIICSCVEMRIGAEEMAHWLENLPHNHGTWAWILSTHIKLDVTTHRSATQVLWGWDGDRSIKRVCWSPAWLQVLWKTLSEE